MYFFIEDDELLREYIWNEVIKKNKEFDREPIYNEIPKTKVKSYGDEATDFQDKGMPKAGPN